MERGGVQNTPEFGDEVVNWAASMAEEASQVVIAGPTEGDTGEEPEGQGPETAEEPEEPETGGSETEPEDSATVCPGKYTVSCGFTLSPLQLQPKGPLRFASYSDAAPYVIEEDAKVPFDKIVFDKNRTMGQIRALDTGIVNYYFQQLLAKGPPSVGPHVPLKKTASMCSLIRQCVLPCLSVPQRATSSHLGDSTLPVHCCS